MRVILAELIAAALLGYVVLLAAFFAWTMG